MFKPVSTTVHWIGRHAFPAIVGSVIAVGAAGGGIGYAVASQHSTTASVPSTSSSAATPPATTNPKTGSPASRAAQLMQHALTLVATQTGQSVASVRSQLQSGKSIDAIAGAKAPAVETAILAQVQKLADHAVSAGKITATQEATALAAAKTKVEALMAEPRTQLLADAQKFLQLLQNHAARHHVGAASPAPSPAA